MSISRIDNNQVSAASDPARAADSQHRQPAVRKINSEQDVHEKKISEKRPEELQKTHPLSVDMIADYIAQVKASSETIIKFYPPFEAGSGDRVKMLLNFAAFRKLIERLSIPPSAPAEETEAELKSIEIKQTLRNIRAEGLTRDQSAFAEHFGK